MSRFSRPAQSSSLFRGAERGRLMTMIVMLAVLTMLVFRARDPGTWKWLAHDPDEENVPRVGAKEPMAPGHKVSSSPVADEAAAGHQGNAGDSAASALSAKSQPDKAADSDKPAEPNKAVVPDKTLPAETTAEAVAPAKVPADKAAPASAEKPASGTPESAKVAKPELTKPELTATGITDEDADEWEAAQEDFQAVADGSQDSEVVDMPTYHRLLHWVLDQPYELLHSRSRKDVLYGQLIQAPDTYRGKLVHLKLRLLRGVNDPAPKDLKDEFGLDQMYTFWGVTDESRGRFYAIVAVDPPEGLPVSPNMEETVVFDGYFYKVMGYVPGNSTKRNDPLMKAPVLIGRIKWLKHEVSEVNTDMIWWILGGAAFGVLALVRMALFFRPRKAAVQIAPLPPTDAHGAPIDIETWLEQAEVGGPEAGNNHEPNHESYTNGNPVNGHLANGNRSDQYRPLDNQRSLWADNDSGGGNSGDSDTPAGYGSSPLTGDPANGDGVRGGSSGEGRSGPDGGLRLFPDRLDWTKGQD